MKTLLSIVFSLMAASAIQAQDNPPDFDEDVLIFTGEVENYIETAQEVKALNDAAEAEKDEKLLEQKIKVLQQTSLRIANVYFSTTEDSTRETFNNFLSTRLKEYRELRNYFLFIGNAFAAEAARLVEGRKETERKIFIWSSVAGAVLGVGGGYLYIRYSGYLGHSQGRVLLTAAIVGIGIGVTVAGAGYSARYFLPVNQDIKNARDFLVRYPHGEDFTSELIGSQDLTMALDELEEGSQ